MSLKSNVIINMVRSILGILFPLVTFKYASVVLGPEGIGIANYSQSVISYFQLFATFGITTYAISEGSKVRGDKDKFSRFASEVFYCKPYSLCFISFNYITFFCLWAIRKSQRIYFNSWADNYIHPYWC